ncbi:hypothetical protein COCMIDRAFT_30616 [Bipolaris oryzae ATCC 44560]|uniref:Uncharacterized protein n=1 Tax=Bipolaris oryzae ATCC 44560 TaxID=930090 RepID=W6Z9S6_COCMI|nr:uncharacterized protein COCMIDRAFT_30616 [Bipolaris oryzae ATCC 44560]EUC40456.1 hypothetical protein COCMIDRAFT_30616 [Bipolaris oryzae ATCC 44560]
MARVVSCRLELPSSAMAAATRGRACSFHTHLYNKLHATWIRGRDCAPRSTLPGIHQMDKAPSERYFLDPPPSALACPLLLADWLLPSSATANLSRSEILACLMSVSRLQRRPQPWNPLHATRYSATPALRHFHLRPCHAMPCHVHCAFHPAMCPSCCTFPDYYHHYYHHYYHCYYYYYYYTLEVLLHPQPSAVHLSIVRHRISTPPACLPRPLSHRPSPSLLAAIV